jgi:hypothetical protein
LAGNTCPLGNGVGGQRSDFPISQFQLSAFALVSQVWSEDFTAKLFCNVEFWIERLPKLIGVSESLSTGPRMARLGDGLITLLR